MGISVFILILWTTLEPSNISQCFSYECLNVDKKGFWFANAYQLFIAAILSVVVYRGWNLGKLGGEGLGTIATSVSLILILMVLWISNVYSRQSGSKEPYIFL